MLCLQGNAFKMAATPPQRKTPATELASHYIKVLMDSA
jgi:hypothetical protein